MTRGDKVLGLSVASFLGSSILEYFKITPVASTLGTIGICLLIYWFWWCE